jgi:SAM-dependent methyltransferase
LTPIFILSTNIGWPGPTLVLASWVLEHLADPEADFRAIGRVLRPGALFIFITPNKRHPLMDLNRWIGRVSGLQDRLVRRLYGRQPADTFPAHDLANTAADLRRLADNSQMRMLELLPIPDPTYLAFVPALYRLSCWFESRLPPGRHIHLVGCMKRME